jgi:hypothetical protein
VTYHRNYCTECDWSASTERYTRHEVGKRAITHFCNTNYTIESERIPEFDKAWYHSTRLAKRTQLDREAGT